MNSMQTGNLEKEEICAVGKNSLKRGPSVSV